MRDFSDALGSQGALFCRSGALILAAGLTPAWQQILRFSQLNLGEVNRALEAHGCASGKVLNVGLALHHLRGGENARTLALVGGTAGNAIMAEFAQLGAAARWVASGQSTRVCTTVLEQSGRTTELVENAAAVAASELRAFAEAYVEEAAAAELVVLSGSLPEGTPADYYRHLLERTHAGVLADARGAELQAMLLSPRPPLVVKPNRQELEATLGRPLGSDAELVRGMRELNEAGADWVVVSQGASAVWLTSVREVVRFVPPRLAAVNAIGCGDCLAAGITHALAEGQGMTDAVRYGIGAAGDNLTQLLPARLSAERVEQIAARVVVERC